MRLIPPPLRRRLGALALALLLASPAAADDAAALARALAAAEARDWAAATDAARAAGPVASDIVDWMRLRAGAGSFAEAAAFLARAGDWPGLDPLREKAEAKAAGAPPEALRAFFAGAAPRTAAGADAWLSSLPAADQPAAAAALWSEARIVMTPAAEAAFRARWAEALKGRHMARAEALLDARQPQAALGLLPLLSHADADMVQLRADLQMGGPRLAERIAALGPTARAHPGLLLERFRWRLAQKDTAGAEALLLEASAAPGGPRAPALVAGKRADLARAALRAGEPARARRLAEGHGLPPGDPAWVDLEWLAGDAALKSGDAEGALAHFRALERSSPSAITQARALYWQARATADPAAAQALMRRAAAHQSAWYGQLAAEAAGVPMDPALLAGMEAVPDWRGAPILSDRRVQAALWLLAAGAPDTAQRFLLAAAAQASGRDCGRMARLMAEFGHTHHALRLAKAAAQKGAVYPAVLFPVDPIGAAPLAVPPELVLSIARRESEFNAAVASPAGARGLMQVMPDTARHIAADVGLPFNLPALSAEAGYNALFGATYLAGLRARFGPSIALVAAGYNAGPGRPAQWIRGAGDPRAGADPVDWVEAIPFDETRNYVMRVAEALPIYRARLAGVPVPLTPTLDLTGGGMAAVPAPPAPPAITASARPPLRAAVPVPTGDGRAAALAPSIPPPVTD